MLVQDRWEPLQFRSWVQAKLQKEDVRAHTEADTVHRGSVHSQSPEKESRQIQGPVLCGITYYIHQWSLWLLCHKRFIPSKQIITTNPEVEFALHILENVRVLARERFSQISQTRVTANSSKGLRSQRPLFWRASSLQDGTLPVFED